MAGWGGGRFPGWRLWSIPPLRTQAGRKGYLRREEGDESCRAWRTASTASGGWGWGAEEISSDRSDGGAPPSPARIFLHAILISALALALAFSLPPSPSPFLTPNI